MSRLTATWLGVILACVAVAAGGWALISPTVSKESAGSLALAVKGGQTAGWQVTFETLSIDGNRPPQIRNASSNAPRCWGAELPLAAGCFFYPMWWVYLEGPAGVCDEDMVLVDGRKGTVAGGWAHADVCIAIPRAEGNG